MSEEDDFDRLLCWRCRRGMLELDLVLGRFLEQHRTGLAREQKNTLLELLELLELPDNDLWDLIQGRTQSDNTGFMPVLTLLRAA